MTDADADGLAGDFVANLPAVAATSAFCRDPPVQGRGECQAFWTKLSMTFLSPALSNETVSLLPSTDLTLP